MSVLSWHGPLGRGVEKRRVLVPSRHYPIPQRSKKNALREKISRYYVGEDVLRILDGLFGVHHPFLVAQGSEELLPRLGRGECPTAAREGQVALRVDLCKTREVEAPEATREDTDGQEEVGPTWHPTRAIRCHPPSGEDTMQMGMMVQLLPPGVQHGEAPDLRAEMLRVPGDVLERLSDRAKE